MAFAPGKQEEAIAKAQELRAAGKAAGLAMAACVEAEARSYQESADYAELLYIG